MAKGTKHVLSTRSALITAWKRSGAGLSLKTFAREHPELGHPWFMNKKANEKAPLKKIGSTRKKKGGNGKQ